MLKTLLLLGLAAASAGAAAAIPEQGRSLAATCAGCHGSDGRPPAGSAIPALAGRGKEELLQKLQAFRAGTVPATVMTQISRGYSEAQLELLAAYFAACR